MVKCGVVADLSRIIEVVKGCMAIREEKLKKGMDVDREKRWI